MIQLLQKVVSCTTIILHIFAKIVMQEKQIQIRNYIYFCKANFESIQKSFPSSRHIQLYKTKKKDYLQI